MSEKAEVGSIVEAVKEIEFALRQLYKQADGEQKSKVWQQHDDLKSWTLNTLNLSTEIMFKGME